MTSRFYDYFRNPKLSEVITGMRYLTVLDTTNSMFTVPHGDDVKSLSKHTNNRVFRTILNAHERTLHVIE